MSQVFGLGLVLNFTDNATAGISATAQAFTGLTESLSAKTTTQAITGIANTAESVGSSLTKSITAPLGGMVTMLAKAGFSRATFVQQAQFAFQSLMGGAKEASSYMQELMDFAKKTPFRYETITNGAQSLISYGVEAKKVIPVMTAVGDAMGGMGKTQNDMAGVIDVLSRINAEGSVSALRLRQLAMKGIQADKIIGNMHGIQTMEKAQEYVKKMNASQFLDDLTKGLEEGTNGVLGMTAAFQGMMSNMKNTWAGAVDTFKSSITNAGLELMGMYQDENGLTQYTNLDKMTRSLNNMGTAAKAIAPLFKPMVDTIFSGMEKASEKIRDFAQSLQGIYNTAVAWKQLKEGTITAEQFANATWGASNVVHSMIEKFKTLNEEFNGVPAKIAEMIPNILGIATALGPVLLIVGKLGGIPLIANLIGSAFDVLTGKVLFDLVPAVKDFGTTLVQAKGDFAKSIQGFKQAAQGFMEIGSVAGSGMKLVGSAVSSLSSSTLKPALSATVQFGKNVGKALKTTFTSVIPELASGAWNNVLNIFDTIAPKVSNKLSALGTVIKTGMSNAFKGLRQKSAGFNAMIDFFSETKTAVPVIFDALKTIISYKMQSIGEAISNVVNGIKSKISPIFSTIGSTVSKAFSTVVNIMSTVGDKIGSAVGNIVPKISNTTSKIGEVFRVLGSAVANSSFVTSAKGVFAKIGETISSGASKIGSAVSTVKEATTTQFDGFGGEIKSKFASAFSGVTSGVAERLSPIKDKVGTALSGMVSRVSSNMSVFNSVLSSKFNQAKEPPYEWAEGVSEYVQKSFDLTKGTDIATAVERGWLKLKDTTSETTEDMSSKFTGASGKIMSALLKAGSGGAKALSGLAKGAVFATKGLATVAKGVGKLTVATAKVGAKMAVGSLAIAGFFGAVAMGRKDVGEMTNDISNKMTAFTNGITNVMPQLTSMITSLTTQFASQAPQMIAGISTAVSQLCSALPQVFNQLVSLIPTILPQITQVAVQLVQGLADCFVNNAPMIITGIATAFTAVTQSIDTLLPTLMSAGAQIIAALVNGLAQNSSALISGAVQVIQALIQGLSTSAPILLSAGLNLILQLGNGIMSNLPLLLNMAMQLVLMFVEGIMSALPQLLAVGLSLLMQLVQGIVSALPQLITTAMQLIPVIINGILQVLPQLIMAGVQIIMYLIMGIVQCLPQIMAQAMALIPIIVNSIISMLPQLVDAGIQILLMLIKGIIEMLPIMYRTTGEMFKGLFNAIRHINWLKLGINIIKNIINGILSMGKGLVDIIKGLITGKGIDFSSEGQQAGNSYTSGIESSVFNFEMPQMDAPGLDTTGAKNTLASFTTDVESTAQYANETLGGIQVPNFETDVEVNGTDNASGVMDNIEQKAGTLNGVQCNLEFKAVDSATPVMDNVTATANAVSGTSTNVNVNANDNASGVVTGVQSAVSGVPAEHTTDLKATDNASGACSNVTAKVNAIPRTHTTILRATDRASTSINKVKSLLNNLPKTKTITLNVQQNGTIPHNATGTNNFVGGMTWVNEQGGELIDLPKGTTIIPHDKSITEAMNRGMQMGADALKGYIANDNNTEPIVPATIAVNQSQDIRQLARAMASDNSNANASQGSPSNTYDYSVTFAQGSIVIQAPQGGNVADYKEIAEYIMKYAERTQQKKAMAMRS